MNLYTSFYILICTHQNFSWWSLFENIQWNSVRCVENVTSSLSKCISEWRLANSAVKFQNSQDSSDKSVCIQIQMLWNTCQVFSALWIWDTKLLFYVLLIFFVESSYAMKKSMKCEVGSEKYEALLTRMIRFSIIISNTLCTWWFQKTQYLHKKRKIYCTAFV
jgi:hypothetical protein